MKIIKNSNTKMEFIQSSGVNSVFSTDITEICDLLLFEKGDFLIREGEIQNYLLFLVKGDVLMTILSHKGFDLALGGHIPLKYTAKPVPYGAKFRKTVLEHCPMPTAWEYH